MSNAMTNRILAGFAGGLLAAASPAAENVWHYRPTQDWGQGTYGYLVSRDVNWTDEIETITGTHALSFVYTPGENDAGGAYLSRFARNDGLKIIFR